MLRRLRRIARNLAREVDVGQRILRDPRTPRLAKVLLGGGIAYALSPIDLIPDFIPVLGHVDDALIVPLLLILGLALVPDDVVREHRQAVHGEAGASARREGRPNA